MFTVHDMIGDDAKTEHSSTSVIIYLE